MPRPGRPVLWLLGGYLGGLAAARWLSIGPDPRWPSVLVLVVILALAVIGWWSVDRVFEPGRPSVRRLAGFIPPLVAVAAFGLGAITLSAELRPRLPSNHVARLLEASGGRMRAVVEARVVNAERAAGSGAAILVDVEALETGEGRQAAAGRMLLRVERGVIARPTPGDRLRVPASLRFPRTFRNPGGYDARAHLALRAVRVVGLVRDYEEATAVARGGLSVRGAIERLRDRVRGALEDAVRGPAAELLRALVLGEDDDLPRAVRDGFQRTGTAHVLAISGLHMALVAAAAFALARRVGGWIAARLRPAADATRGAALAALGPVLLYVALAGAGIAAVRAALMAAAVLVALALGRRLDLWSALALAALCLLAVYPGALFELSFPLSFGAVAAILRLGPWLAGLTGVRDLLAQPPGRTRSGPAGVLGRGARRAGAWIAGATVVSAAAGLGTGPLLAAAFGRLTPWAPLANLVVVPLVSGVAVGLGLVGAAVALVAPAAAAPLFQADAALLDLVLLAVDSIARWPGAVVWVPTPTVLEVVLAYAALWLVPTAWGKGPAPSPPTRRARAARTAVLAAAVCLLVAGVVRVWPLPAGTMRVTFLDVGAGETALVELPNGERLLVDSGTTYAGAFDVGERVVVPFLLGRGVTRIDVLLLTEPRPDRQGGLPFLVQALPIGEVWLPPGAPQVGGLLGRLLADRRIPIYVKRPGDPPTVFGAAELTVLPGPSRLAFELALGEVAVVYPPDGPGAPQPAGWNLSSAGLGATVLHWPRSAVPGYGIGPLLDVVRPDVVVVAGETGRRALRELPELLDVMEIRGARVFLPERDGAIILTTDGRALRIRTLGGPDPAIDGL